MCLVGIFFVQCLSDSYRVCLVWHKCACCKLLHYAKKSYQIVYFTNCRKEHIEKIAYCTKFCNTQHAKLHILLKFCVWTALENNVLDSFCLADIKMQGRTQKFLKRGSIFQKATSTQFIVNSF